jgi:hypothetical protein
VSYDLKLFHLPDGVDPEDAFNELAEREEKRAEADTTSDTPLPELVRKNMQSLADLLGAAHPAFEQFQPDPPLRWLELTDEETQVQVTIGEESVDLTMPYFREHAGEMMKVVVTCIGTLTARTDFVTSDPQLGGIVKASDMPVILAQYREMDTKLPKIVRALPDSGISSKPGWKFG